MECPWQAVKKGYRKYANGLFIQMLVFKCLCGLVANFSRAEVLDRTGEHITFVHSPFIALGSKTTERCAIKTNKSLLNYRLHFTMTTLHVEHHSDRNTAGEPLY